ncbi:hypothetical protein [Pseudoalteromonas sp. T1lg88]|uniref:hypothetical protein n=1 Tax=Pseudoalteromonas sp. T1lg88 TaxID=2077104 RepID=UPI000CF6A756|nr:hypothetical protein [Pseudoalteromonas sp. T1lg88]
MFDSIRKKIEEQNKDNNPKNMSLDFKLMFVYHIAMMILFGTRIIDNAAAQALFALALFVVLILISAVHKFRAQWQWPGIGLLGLPSAILGVAFVYAFLAFAAYTINPDFSFPDLQNINYIDFIEESWSVIIATASVPAITPWYLAGIGIGIFNLLSSLKIATTKKSEFVAQCKNS